MGGIDEEDFAVAVAHEDARGDVVEHVLQQLPAGMQLLLGPRALGDVVHGSD